MLMRQKKYKQGFAFAHIQSPASSYANLLTYISTT